MTDINLSATANTEPELGYGELLQILWRRLPWLGGAFALCTGLAAIATVLQSPTYRSSMQLLVEPNVSESISLNSQEGTPPDSSSEIALDYATQLNLMRSKQFVEEVVLTYSDLCLPEESQQDCINRFRNSLSLSQLEENSTRTRIFEAVFTDSDNYLTKKSLEALQRIYLKYNDNQQTARLDNGLKLVDQQIEQVRRDLANSQQALRRFRQSGGTINPEQQSLEASAALDSLVQTQREVQADYQEAQAQFEAAQAALSVDPSQAKLAAKLSQSGRYQTLLDALQTSELALSERLAVYTHSDPVAEDLQAQRDRQVDLLRAESQRLLGSGELIEEADLLSSGQLGENELAIVQNLIDTQIRINGLAARNNSLEQAQQQLQQKLDAYPELIARYDKLQPEVETQRASLEQLLETRQALANDLAQGGFKWEIVESADLGNKISPNPVQNLAVGGVAGLFIGGLLAYGRESIDTVIRTSEDLKKQTALPLLGVLPAVRESASHSSPLTRSLKLSIEDTSSVLRSDLLGKVQWEPFREAVDLIYKNIQLTASSPKSKSKSKLNAGPKSVMVTSAVAGEGRTTLAIGLALSAARSQKRVLLIDADLRRPSLHEQIGLSNRYGLTTLSDSVETPLPVSVMLANTQIDILPAGSFSEDPVRLLNSHRMRELVAKFEQQYDFVVFDTSNVLGQVDALQIASLCEGVVIISRLERVTQSDLSQATAILAPVNQLGIVANGSRRPLSSHSSPFLPEPSFSNNGRAIQSESPLSSRRH